MAVRITTQQFIGANLIITMLSLSSSTVLSSFIFHGDSPQCMSPTSCFIYMVNVLWHQTLQVIESMNGVDSRYIVHTGDKKLRGMSYTIQYKILVGESSGGGGAEHSSVDCNVQYRHGS